MAGAESKGSRRYDKENLLWQSTVAIKSDPVGSDLVNEFKDAKVKGEVALVIAGSNPKFARKADTSKEIK